MEGSLSHQLAIPCACSLGKHQGFAKPCMFYLQGHHQFAFTGGGGGPMLSNFTVGVPKKGGCHGMGGCNLSFAFFFVFSSFHKMSFVVRQGTRALFCHRRASGLFCGAIRQQAFFVVLQSKEVFCAAMGRCSFFHFFVCYHRAAGLCVLLWCLASVPPFPMGCVLSCNPSTALLATYAPNQKHPRIFLGTATIKGATQNIGDHLEHTTK